MDFVEHVCRLCLQNSTSPSNTSIEDNKIRCKLDAVFNFPITSDEAEPLPSRVCVECFGRVTDFHAFSEAVRSNQEQLKARKRAVVALDEGIVKSLLKQEPVLKEEDVQEDDGQPDPEEDPDFGGFSDREDTLDETLNIKAEIESPDVDSDDQAEYKPPVAKKQKLTKRKKAAKENRESTVNDDSGDDQQSQEKRQRRAEGDKLISEFFPLKCEPCSETFESFLEFKRHTRKTHNKPIKFNCCDKELSRRGDILNHIAVHTNSKFECDICGKKFSRFYCLQAHQQLHGTQEKPFKCTQCDRSFSKKSFLTTHQKMHLDQQCPICQEIVIGENSASLRKHIAEKHETSQDPTKSNESKLICATCGKQYSFYSRKAFARHVKRHTGEIGEERVQCHICSQWLSCKTYLKIHIDTRHNEEDTRIECDVCHQVYPNRKCLMTHKQRVHIEEKFACDLCERKFKRRINLVEHRAAKHTGQTLYSCEDCSMVTNSNATLYAHRKKKHPEKWLEANAKAAGVI